MGYVWHPFLFHGLYGRKQIPHLVSSSSYIHDEKNGHAIVTVMPCWNVAYKDIREFPGTACSWCSLGRCNKGVE